MATRQQKRQSSPAARGRKSKHPDRSSRKEKELQREVEDKTREINELKASLSKAKSDTKEAEIENAKWQETVEILEEKQQELQAAVRRQAGVIEIFEAGEKASVKRFQCLHSECLQLRSTNKKLLATQEKIATEVRLQINQLLALHPDSDTDTTTEQPEREKDAKKKRGAADADSSSDSESEAAAARRAPAAGKPGRKEEAEHPADPNKNEAPVGERSLSAETLPMSPRMPPLDVSVQPTDMSMPEPTTTQPTAFEPSTPSAPDDQKAMSAAVE